MTQTNRTALWVAVAAVVAGGAGFGLAKLGEGRPAAPAAEGAAAPEQVMSLEIPAEHITSSNIGVEAVGSGNIGAEVLAPAKVVAAPKGEAIVTANAAGKITLLSKQLGDVVKPGDVLATVES